MSAPYEFSWINVAAGTYTLTARATDSVGATATSTPVIVTIGASPSPVIIFDFEVARGFTPGALAGQGAWRGAVDGVLVTTEAAQSGTQSVVILPGPNGGTYKASTILPRIEAGQKVRFIDFWLKPVAAETWPYLSSNFSLGGSPIIAFVREGNQAELQAFYSNEGAEDRWHSGLAVPLGLDGVTQNWVRLTLRQDFSRGKADVFLDGRLAIIDLPFKSSDGRSFNLFGHSVAPTRLDTFRILSENPLFADIDKDGMDDLWEAAHGLVPSVDDRDSDLDGDGMMNIREITLDTHPDKLDTDADGLPDGWEVNYGFNPLQQEPAMALNEDIDGDGLTLLQEGRAGTNPFVPDTDGDGLNDGVEVSASFNPLNYDPDADGDGLSNADEIANGTNPVDYYNGQQPVMTSLVPPDGTLLDGNHVAVRITNAIGEPLANASVTFTAQTADHGFSPTWENRWANARKSIRVRADESGIARAYVVRADELLNPLP